MPQSFLTLLNQVAAGWPGRTEADIQSDVRQLLILGEFLEDMPYLESQTGDGTHRRIDIQYGSLVVECKKKVDQTHRSILLDDEKQLAGYLNVKQSTTGSLWAGILTDGTHWRHYRLSGEDSLILVSKFDVPTSIDEDRSFRMWLGSAIPTARKVKPTSSEIEGRLGSSSPSHNITTSRLLELLIAGKNTSEVSLKRELWEKLLRTAFGTQFDGTDELFVEHSYLVVLATVIAHAAIGLPVDVSADRLLSGELFASQGISGVGEAGFFDWLLDVEGGFEIVADVTRRVQCFDWTTTDHDVLKSLYQSVISPEVRHKLGEYYTPDWLANKIISKLVTDPLHQRVLDPACGSGTFLFAAIDNYFAAANTAELSTRDAVDQLPGLIAGIDIHPVAVSLAQVTYLLAIGIERLSHRTGGFSVPVYLGDSIRWDDPARTANEILYSNDDVVIHTTDNLELFASELRFPADVAIRPDFDSLVSELTEKAASRKRKSTRPAIAGVLDKYTSNADSRKTLKSTYETLCDLHDSGRDHIWGYFVRNQARPAWFSHDENRVDVLVGNPPWLSFRFMPELMKERFRTRSRDRNLWSGKKVATQQDLSAFFVARTFELYLKNGGSFGFVMPFAVLSRQSYEGFRSGRWTSESGPASVCDFDTPWSLQGMKPTPFPVPSSVVFGHKTANNANRAMPSTVELLTGVVSSNPRLEGLEEFIVSTNETVAALTRATVDRSPYSSKFKNGATLFPRCLVFVENGPPSTLAKSEQVSVQSRRTSQEKKPWKDLEPLTGVIERQFIRPVLLGESIIPFRALDPLQAAIPWESTHGLISATDSNIERYSGFAKWMFQAEAAWEGNKSSSSKLSFIDQLNYMHKLDAQFPLAPIRVVYTASGNTLAAAIVTDGQSIIEHALYWAAVPTEDEARYLTGILNSPAFTAMIRPLQSTGAFGPRHFDTYVWVPKTPLFDATKSTHQELVALSMRAEEIASSIEQPERGGFQTWRSSVRTALASSGVSHALNDLVRAVVPDFAAPDS